MGNRAIIQTKASHESESIGVYLHWNGGRDSVEAFLKYCELKGYRAPDQDYYGWARLCQVIGNYFGGIYSVGIDNFSKDAGEWQDNGTYIIEGWQIIDRKCWDSSYIEQYIYDLTDMLVEIDKAQPESEQLGEEFLRAAEIPTSELKIGDEVYIREYEGKYNFHKVVGFGADEVRNGHRVKGVPYIDLYDHDGDYSWNINNYILQDAIKIVNRNK